jgi:hypothetical protein
MDGRAVSLRADEMTLPPRQRCSSPTPHPYPRDGLKADVAIGPEDVTLGPTSGLLNVTSAQRRRPSADNIVVQVREMETGVVIGEQIIKHLDAPLDLKPRTEGLEFPNLDAQARRGVEVILDRNKLGDLTRLNNRVVHRF